MKRFDNVEIREVNKPIGLNMALCIRLLKLLVLLSHLPTRRQFDRSEGGTFPWPPRRRRGRRSDAM